MLENLFEIQYFEYIYEEWNIRKSALKCKANFAIFSRFITFLVSLNMIISVAEEFASIVRDKPDLNPGA